MGPHYGVTQRSEPGEKCSPSAQRIQSRIPEAQPLPSTATEQKTSFEGRSFSKSFPVCTEAGLGGVLVSNWHSKPWTLLPQQHINQLVEKDWEGVREGFASPFGGTVVRALARTWFQLKRLQTMSIKGDRTCSGFCFSVASGTFLTSSRSILPKSHKIRISSGLFSPSV